MPGSGGAFDVEVQWLGDDEDPLDDELLERLTSSVHSGRTVQSFADALFEKHGAKLNLSGDAQSLSDTIVAYRESLDIDDDEEAAPVELDDVVAESSLLTFRPRVPDADAVLFVAYALAEKGAVKIHLLREMSVAEIAPGTCGELATTLAPGRAHDPRDLDFFAASEYSARAEDRGSIHTSLGSDYKAGLDRYVRVDGSASVSEVVEARRGRRACHVLLFESARMRLRVVAIQPGAEDVALELPPRQPDEVVGAKCVTYVAESVRLALLDNAADAAIPATSLTDLQGVLLDLESDGYLTAYSELETREGGRGPRSPLRLSAPVVPDPRDDLCGAQCFIHVEIERGEKSWLVVLMEKLKAWQERPSRGTLKIQFSDDLGPLHDPKTITLRSGMMGMPFKGIAKFSLARAIEDANVVRDLQLPQHARLWTAVERGPSLHDFLSSDGFKSLHKDDPSLQDVLMSDSMLDVPPSRGDRGPESEYCLEVILSGLVLPATEVHVVLRVQTGQLFEPPNCMVTREKQHLDGSVFDLLENWLEVNGPAEKSRDATVHVVSCLLNPRSTATFLPHMKFSVKVDNDDAIDLGDDVYQDLKLTEAGRPAGVIVELIYDSDQGAGAEKCLLMLCVGPKGSIARKFFDIDDALLETTQAELACRTLGAARGNLRVEDVVQHSIFRMSAHYADARAPIDRKNVASGLENHNGSSELLKGAKLTLASDTLREAMEVVPRNSRFIVCHASHAAPSRSPELFATVSVVNGRGDSILQHAGVHLVASARNQGFGSLLIAAANWTLQKRFYYRSKRTQDEIQPHLRQLINWVLDPASERSASCNGEPMRSIGINDGIEEAAARLGTQVYDVRLEIVVHCVGPSDAPASEAERFWLCPEIPPLVRVCWAALADGVATDESERATKKLGVLARIGNPYAEAQLKWFEVSRALGTFPRPDSLKARRYRDMCLETLTNDSFSVVQDSTILATILESYPRRDLVSAFDAVHILRLKRMCSLIQSSVDAVKSKESNDQCCKMIGEFSYYARTTLVPQDMRTHPHLAVAHLLFAFSLLDGDGKRLTMFGIPVNFAKAPLVPDDDKDVAFCLSRAILPKHDFSDYDADSEARVRQALEDLSVLWMGKNPSSEKHLEAAAAAGNAFAAAVVERLRAGPPSRKLARKYDLTAFGAPFLELLPRGLRDLEQVISKYPVAQRKIRGPDRALEASRNEDAPREEEAPRSKAEVDKEIEEAMDKLEDVFVDAVAPAPASKKNAKKKAKKKAKAKEAKAEETSVAARDAHGSASIAHSDSDESFKSALCETPKARSPAAPPSEPLVAPADGADSDDWVDVSAARRGKGAAKRVESSPPPPTPPPPPRVPSPPPPPSPSSPGADGLLPALKRFVETHSVDDTACILDETDAIQRALLERLEKLEATAGDVGDWSAVVADFLEETRENEANERAFAEEAQGVVDPEEEWRASFEREEAERRLARAEAEAADRLRAEERRLEGESEALARQLDAEDRREAAARQAAAAGRGPRSWGAAPAPAPRPRAAPRQATSAFDRVPKAELQRRVKAFVDAQGVDGKCRRALEAYAVRDADACVRFLRAAPGDLGSVDDQNAYVLSAIHGKFLLAASASELKALAPELRDIVDALALTSDVAKALRQLSLAQQRRAAERLADPGVMFGVLARNAFILAELKKQKQGCLLRDGHGASVDADLVAALDGLRLSKRCYRKLRDLNPKGQGFCALALESADLSTITDVSGYVEKGLEKGTLLRRGRELMDARPREAPRSPPRRGAPAPAPVAAPPVSAWGAPRSEPAPASPWSSLPPPSPQRGDGLDPIPPPSPAAAPAPVPAWTAASHEPAPAPLWSREDPPGSPPPPHADVPPLFAAAGAWSPEPEAPRPGDSAWDWRAAAPAPAPAPAFDGAYDDDDDFVVPEGLVDVERRSNCSLDAIVAVLHRCATFRGAFRDPRTVVGVAGDQRRDHARVIDALEVALFAVDDCDAGGVDAAIDGLRVALGAVEGGRGDLSTSGAHLDVAEVFEALLESLLACKGTRAAKAARAFRASGLISDAPCAACGAKATTTPRDFEDLARAATAFTLADAARRGASLESAFRDAHAACAKSCDHCKAPGSVDVLVAIHDIPKALALSVAWFTSTPEPADVEGVLRLAHKPLDGAGVFDEPKPGAKPARRLGLFAVVVFQDAHYTALVRDKRADAWTWYDRRDVTLVGSFESMVAKCRNDGGAPLCPYLLFYDAPA